MKIRSLYDKDLFVLKIIFYILIILTILSIIFLTYITFNSHTKEKNDYNLSLVYNSGKNIKVKLDDLSTKYEEAMEYNFSVIGYNRTSKDISYILEGISGGRDEQLKITDSNVNIEIIGTGIGSVSHYGPVIPIGLADNEISLGTGYLFNKNEIVMHKYLVKIWLNGNLESSYGDINTNECFSIDFKLKTI